jgi:hypothetical protein
MGAVKFLAKYLAAVLKSPPNTQTKHRDVHDPIRGWIFETPRDTTKPTQKAKRETELKHAK